MSAAREFTFKCLVPSCSVMVTIMACLSFGAGLFSGYLFMTQPSTVSQEVKIVWTTAAGIYSFSSVLLIMGVWLLIKSLGYLYMSLLLVAIAVYTEILLWLWNSLPAAVFTAILISFIFLGMTVNMTKIIAEKKWELGRDGGD